MNAEETLWKALEAGVQLWARGEQLGFRLTEGNLPPELQDGLKRRKPEILQLLGEGKRYCVPSFAQQRLWFLHQLIPKSSAYNISFTFRLRGVLRRTVLDRALTALVRRHETLRTTFTVVQEHPVQLIHDPKPQSIPWVDLQALPIAQRSRVAQRLAAEETQRPFALEGRPPMRLALLRLKPEEHVLLINLHHAITDTWSMGIFFSELAELYGKLVEGLPEPVETGLPALPLQYADFSVWQRRWLSGDNLKRQLSFWKELVGDDPPVLELPTDRPRPNVPRFRGKMSPFALPASLGASLSTLARQQGATLAMVSLAGFFALLYRTTGQPRILVGSPIAGRNRDELERLHGFFINSVTMVGDVTADSTGRTLGFREFLQRVKKMSLEVYNHQELPFEKLVEELGLTRDLARNPLFQVSFVFQNAPAIDLQFPGLTVEAAPWDAPVSRFDLELHAWESEGDFGGLVAYDTDLFDATTIERLKVHYRRLLESVTADPETSLDELAWLSAAEEHQLLVEWNPSATPSHLSAAQGASTAGIEGGERTVVDLFFRLATETPDAVVLSHEGRGGPERFLSRGEVARRARILAQHLRGRGVGRETTVGVLTGRTLEWVIAFVAVLEAGGVYLPLDPEAPPERLRWMLHNTSARVLLVAPSEVSRMDPLPEEVCKVRMGAIPPADCAPSSEPPRRGQEGPLEAWTGTSVGSSTTPSESSGRVPAGLSEFEGGTNGGEPTIRSENLAYVIHTSGSTGRPKGVAISHRSLLDLVHWHRQTYRLTEADRTTQVAAVGFDLSVWEIWSSLASGASLHLPHEATRHDPTRLVAYLASRRITLGNLATPMTELVLEENLSDLRLRALLTGGDRLGAVERHLDFPLINHYGPTESTVIATRSTVKSGDPGPTPPIGRPLGKIVAYVTDGAGWPLPIGAVGEVRLGGSGLARGYLGQPARTAERFVPNPFDRVGGGRLYRTGDRARLLADGCLDFLGRQDHQVKLRGFRIELGEIEGVLREAPEVDQGVVVVGRGTGEGEERLVAYVTPSASVEEDDFVAQLRSALRRRLPEYMMPSSFVVLEKLPRTASGKVDRQALPAPGRSRRPQSGGPQNRMQATIAEVWREVLGLEEVGVDESFFELGGNSLALVRVRERLRKALAGELREVAVVDLFQHPTVRGLAEALAPAKRPTGERSSPQHSSPQHSSTQHSSPQPSTAQPLTAANPREDEPLAIVAMSGRFPGAANIEELWSHLCAGVESISFFRDEELAGIVADEILADPAYVKAGGVLEGIDLFDADFFGFTPAEAAVLDPQHRLFLECAWEALERAGQDPRTFPGSIGVFAGVGMSTYLQHNLAGHLSADPSAGFEVGLANGPATLPTRVSYKFNLKGPSVAVQSACSTSLVAVNLACESLRAGRSDMALAGGVSIHVPQKSGHYYQPGMVFSPDGHCRAFDAAARGTVFGNGVGVVLLKRLRDAVADGNPIHAVLRGFCTNNDGSQKVGYTAPGIAGQTAVIRSALQMADINPETVAYVEAHGTGTELGDPIEIAALTQAFQEKTSATGYCAVGTIKTNVGHLDNAAGVAGLIKTALSLEHAQIVPSLHFKSPNAEIDFPRTPFYVNTELRAWPQNGSPRRAGVSAFGIGGTNAHAVLEEAPARLASGPARSRHLLLISARTASALEEATQRLMAYLEHHPELDLADVAYTLHVGRSRFAHRRMLVCGDREEALKALKSGDPERLPSRHDATRERPVAFLFPGQGPQYVDMGRGLYQEEPIFRQEVDRCAEILEPLLGVDLRGVLYPTSGEEEEAARQLANPALTHPIFFTVEVALARLWMSWGVRPRAMIGHSSGEVAAAHIAGVLSLPDALKLATVRGRLASQLPSGAMLSVLLSAEDLEPLLPDGIALAAINAPDQCVAAGPRAAVDALAEELTERGVEVRSLHISQASHCALVDPILEALTIEVQTLELRPPEIPYLSNVTGQWITDAEATDPSYWARHLRSTVRFADSVAELSRGSGGEAASYAFLEVGPGRSLTTFVSRQKTIKTRGLVLPTLPHPRERESDLAFLWTTLGRLWLAGVHIDAEAFYGQENRRRELLPTYPFERQSHWIEPSAQSLMSAPNPPLAAGLGRDPASLEEGVSTPPVGAPMNPVEERLLTLWQELLGIEDLGLHDNFFEVGGSSLLAVRLLARVRQLFETEISPHALLKTPTIASLARTLNPAEDPKPEDRSPCLVQLSPGRGGRGQSPLFLVHAVGGHVYSYRELVEALSLESPVYGLRALGTEDGEEPLESIEEMAARYLEAIRPLQSRGPYLLAGHSMGGAIAYEMARQLLAEEQDVGFLALLDTPGPGQMPTKPADDRELLSQLVEGRVAASELAPEDPLASLLEKLQQAEPELALETNRAQLHRHLKVLKAHFQATFDYQPGSLPGRLTFFRAQERRPQDPTHPERPWIELAQGGVEVHVVPGDHLTMDRGDHLPVLADRLKTALGPGRYLTPSEPSQIGSKMSPSLM